MYKNKNMFTVGEDWCIIVYFKNQGEFSDDEIVQSNIDEIVKYFGADNWAKWVKIYIKPEEK